MLLSLDPIAVVASRKAPTTPDVTTGITNAVRAVVETAQVALSSFSCIIIGTTHFVNAVVQRAPSLQRVTVIRLCGGAEHGFGRGLPPFIDFPADLRSTIQSPQVYFCEGGFQISGTEISQLDEAEIERVAEDILKANVPNVVISGMYSPIDHGHETRARNIMKKYWEKNAGSSFNPRITLSHEVSGLGFLARENASILNATLRPLAERTIYSYHKAMETIFEDTPYTLYLTQNDGSVLSAHEAIELPIRTFNSGPTNSIRGGEFLWRAATSSDQEITEKEPLIVIDIGGTTSDSGLLLPNGLPRMSSIMCIVGGVRTNFALPAVESIGLGGGSIVRTNNEGLSVGPESVGLDLLTKSKLFGGDYLTATDVAAASGINTPNEQDYFSKVGDIERVRKLRLDVIQSAQDVMRQKIEKLVDRTKIQKGDINVLTVGGGAPILRIDKPLAGVRAVRTVKGGEVANAVGAAISRVSGIVDTVVDTSNQTIKEAQDMVADLARQKAVDNGAKPETVEIAEVTILPIQYVDARARILIRAVGELGNVCQQPIPATLFESSPAKEYEKPSDQQKETHVHASLSNTVDLEAYVPNIEDNQWIISSTDLGFISQGCKILGCGGGGDPYQAYLKLQTVLERAPGSIRVVSPEYLPDESTVGWTGFLGSPEVSMERLTNNECVQAHDELLSVLKIPPVSGFIAVEIGGGNGLVNLGVAAHYGVPCVDGDFMGRAYPTAWQVTPNVYGSSSGEALIPVSIASGDGSSVIMTKTRTDKLVDSALRASCVEMGCSAGSSEAPKTARTVREQAISNTISLAWWIGRAIALEKNISDMAQRVIDEVGGSESAAILGHGKVTSVKRVLKTGHSYGVLEVDGALTDGTKATIKVPFKNENAYVEAVIDGKSQILASVPDLIAVLDAETGSGLGTPEYKYGLRIVIIAIAGSTHWTDTKRGMELGGPSSMGFDDIEYRPIGKYNRPRSVLEVFKGLENQS